MNLFVDIMNSVVDISKILFVSKFQLTPNSRIFVTVESLCSEMFLIIYLLKEDFHCAIITGAVKEKVGCNFNNLTTSTHTQS